MLLTVTWISSGAAAALTTPGSRVAEPRMPEMHVFVHSCAQLFFFISAASFNKSVIVGFFFYYYGGRRAVFLLPGGHF